jgi:DNA-binding MarR family transcriptional regulator
LDDLNKSELIQEIMRLEMQIQHTLRDDAPHALLALNLTISQLKTLFLIDLQGEMNFKNLAAALGVSPPNVTGIVDRLVEHGLVSREYNQQNRREAKLKLTSRGDEIIDGLRERLSSQQTGLLERLEVKDLTALAQGLSALSRAAEQEKSEQKINYGQNNVGKTSHEGLVASG